MVCMNCLRQPPWVPCGDSYTSLRKRVDERKTFSGSMKRFRVQEGEGHGRLNLTSSMWLPLRGSACRSDCTSLTSRKCGCLPYIEAQLAIDFLLLILLVDVLRQCQPALPECCPAPCIENDALFWLWTFTVAGSSWNTCRNCEYLSQHVLPKSVCVDM